MAHKTKSMTDMFAENKEKYSLSDDQIPKVEIFRNIEELNNLLSIAFKIFYFAASPIP